MEFPRDFRPREPYLKEVYEGMVKYRIELFPAFHEARMKEGLGGNISEVSSIYCLIANEIGFVTVVKELKRSQQVAGVAIEGEDLAYWIIEYGNRTLSNTVREEYLLAD